ncbi:MAG TPA: TIGR04283 family arsenosugar biosynthesis glycosyltransferase [Clostridia bacterium]|nr:TIGR04283 family arsenosugar biosynthesis glycosyltransferase [Clostridia bacterium]
MKTSIIIPILNESKSICKLVEMLKELKGDKEVIFVDGGSKDGTQELIPSNYIAISSDIGRGIQMNKGAEHATGDVLLFLHCDSILERNALKSVQEAIASGFAAGCFTMKFDKKQWLLSIIAYLSNLRVKLFGIIFGDQGMFVRKDIFHSTGGFLYIPIMEDMEFSNRLRKAVKIKLLKNTIVTSARRFEKKGILRTILFMHRMKILYWLGKSPEELYQIYKDVR